jgi:hypothetical protein
MRIHVLSVVSMNFEVIERTGRVCTVSGFAEEYGSQDETPIVSAATLYQDPETGNEAILVVKEALYFPSLPHTLLNPNQINHAGNEVWDNPFDPDKELKNGCTFR